MSMPDETKGGWIAYTNWVMDCRPLVFHPVAFRKDFNLAEGPAGGKLIVSAADKYALWLNGRLVGYGPARSFPHDKLYDEYDITPHLRKGTNRLAALVLPCTGANFLANYTRMGLFLQADVRTGRKSRVFVASDESWDCRIADWTGLDYLLVSAPVGAQEHVDAAHADETWKTGAPDASWTKALYLGPAGYPPFINLVKRPIPLLTEERVTPKLVWTGNASRNMPDTSENLARLFNDGKVAGVAMAPKAATGTFENDKHNVWVFDFGRTRLVRPVIDIIESTGPARIELYHDTKFEGRPTAEMGFQSPMEGGCDSCRVSGPGHKWEVLVPRGLRFMSVKVAGKGRVRFRLACRAVDYPYREGARFDSSDSFFDSAWEVSKNNIRSSTNDVVVDCCNRENLLWTMDAAATLKAAFYSFGETRMWRRCLDLIGQGVDPEGRPAAIVPTDVPSSLFDQTMHWVLSIREYYMATGDETLLDATAAPLRRYLSMCARHVTKDNVFVPPAWSWHWLDWAPIDKRPYSLPVNALLVMACDAACHIAGVTGDNKMRRVASGMGKNIRKAIGAFWDPREEAFRSHIAPKTRLVMPALKPNSRTPESSMAITHNVHSNILATVAGCGTPAMRRAAMRYAAECFGRPRGPINQLGIGYADILLSPLITAGHASVALSKITSMYQPFLDLGAPTWASQASFASVFNTAHGWAAALNSLIVEGLIGLKPAEPGWKAVTLSPPTGVDFAYQYALDTPAGTIEVEHDAGKRVVRIPKGVSIAYRGKSVKGTGKRVVLK